MGRWIGDLGLEVTEVSPARVVAVWEAGPDHHMPFGVVHGGVFATIVESVGSIGASAAVAERGQYSVGTHNATDFLRPVVSGTLDVVATPVIQGRVQQLWTVDITRRGDGKLVAQGRLRLQNIPRPPSAD